MFFRKKFFSFFIFSDILYTGRILKPIKKKERQSMDFSSIFETIKGFFEANVLPTLQPIIDAIMGLIGGIIGGK